MSYPRCFSCAHGAVDGHCRGQADAIKSIGKFFYPVSPTAPYASVTTDNAGEAGAVIVANPGPHTGKVYNLVGPAYTNADLAAAFTATLGKPIEFVEVPYEGAKASFLEKGWPEWQVNGIIELFKAINGGAYGYHHDDFTDITGKAPTTIQQYIEVRVS